MGEESETVIRHRHYTGEQLEFHGFRYHVLEQHKAFKALARLVKDLNAEGTALVHSVHAVTDPDEPDYAELYATVSVL